MLVRVLRSGCWFALSGKRRVRPSAAARARWVSRSGWAGAVVAGVVVRGCG